MIIVALIIGGLFYSFSHIVENVTAASIKGSSNPSLSHHPNTLQKKPSPLHGMSLKIVSPEKGQHIPAYSNFRITGVSSYNSTSNCQVLLLLNDLKPYQKTTPMGKGGSAGSDYSKWEYVVDNSKYGSIKEGVNKITSKLTCGDHSNIADSGLTKWYSVNITGIAAKQVGSGNTLLSKSPVKYTSAHPTPSVTSLSNSSKEDSLRSSTSVYKPIEPTNIAAKDNASLRTLVAYLSVGKDPITSGEKQTVKVTVSDAITNAKLAGAKVTTDIQPTSTSTVERQLVGITGPDGMVSKSWKIDEGAKFETTYNIYANISVVGYRDKTISGTFKEVPLKNTLDSINNKVDNLSSKIFEEVRRGFDQNALIPKLPVPFD